MIAQCIAILAIVGQLNAAVCPHTGLPRSSNYELGSGSISRSVSSGSVSNVGSASPVIKVPVASGRSSGVSVSGSSTTASGSSGVRSITRNLVGQGKYPVALKNCGPTPDKQIPVHTTHITAPVQEKPTISLKTRIPAPKTVCHTCTCYKTVVRPRVQQQIITVPIVQRYIQTTHRPVVEQIHYEAAPVNCDDSVSASEIRFVEAGSTGPSGVDHSIDVSSLPAPQVQDIQPHQLPEFVVDTPQQTGIQAVDCQAPQVQTVNVPAPQVETVQVQTPQVQTVQVPAPQVQIPTPRFETVQVQVPQVQTVQTQVPQVQTVQVQAPQVETVQVQTPQVQTVQVPAPQVQVPTPRFETVQVQAPQVHTVQVPTQRFETVRVQTPQVQTVQVQSPQYQTAKVQSQQVQTVQVPSGLENVQSYDLQKRVW